MPDDSNDAEAERLQAKWMAKRAEMPQPPGTRFSFSLPVRTGETPEEWERRHKAEAERIEAERFEADRKAEEAARAEGYASAAEKRAEEAKRREDARRAAEEARRAAEAAEAKRREEERKPHNRLTAGGYTREASPHDFDNICAAVEVARKKGTGLLFVGHTGCGKTTAARAILPTADFFTALAVREWKGEARRIERPWILDDLGTESAFNDYGEKRELCAEFIFNAFERLVRRPGSVSCIVTTNLQSGEIAERYGERIASRFREFVIVVFTAGDLRESMPVFK